MKDAGLSLAVWAPPAMPLRMARTCSSSGFIVRKTIGSAAPDFMPSFLSPILRDPSHDFALINERNQSIVASRLLTAFESSTRNTGLLRHQALPAQTALILAPSGAIHTVFMKFSLDVAFVARDGRVLKVRGGLKPWRIAGCWGSFAVVEMTNGAMAGVSPGDRLALRSNA